MKNEQPDIFCLNPKYSTTRTLAKERPKVENGSSAILQGQVFLPRHPQRRAEGGLRTKGYFKKSFNDKPLVSIITVVLNGENHLQDSIRSVLNQSYDNVEYIIIDGGSTDGTIDIITQYDSAIDYWVSEPDEGIYDAMNKGIRHSTGEVIGIINSDDWYNFSAVSDVVNAYSKNPEAGIFHGNMNVFDSDDRYITTRKSRNLPILRLMTTPFKHPTCFIKRSVYEAFGKFDLKYRFAADYDLMLRLIKNGVRDVYINKTISNLRKVGITTSTSDVTARNEIFDILKTYTANDFASYLFLNIRLLRRYILNMVGK